MFVVIFKIALVASILLTLLTLLALCVTWILPPTVEKRVNRVSLLPPYSVSPEAQALHRRMFVADLHADSLLWNRDLLRQEAYGHIDLPRLQQANVAIQIFASVTKVPSLLTLGRNVLDCDLITLLALAQGWPPRTWQSMLQRALYAADKLRRFERSSEGQIMLIESACDLNDLITQGEHARRVVGAMLALEGAHALEGRIENLDVLYDAGFRMIGLHHFFDNELGGAAHGIERGGLTQFGREVVRRIQQKRMILDLTHSSPSVVFDAIAVATAPVVVSHTGLRGTCDNSRNLSDEQARGIAATGGVLGIAMFKGAVGGKTLGNTARAMQYGADLVGVDHIAIGSDWDGATETSTDVTGLPILTENLMQLGFSEMDIAKMLGGNIVRVLKQVLL